MTKPLRIAILEDELLVADHLKSVLTDGGYEVTGMYDTAALFLSAIKEQSIDIALLDIHIKGDMDGVEVAHALKGEQDTAIAFLTSNTDLPTAHRVKETNPIAYIAKPYTAEGILSALEIGLHRLELNENSGPEPSTLASEDSIFVRSKKELIRVLFDNITHVQAMDNYCIIHRKDKERLVVPRTLKHMEEELLGHGFTRVHRSYLVNTSMVERIGRNSVHLHSIEIPLSDSHRQSMLAQLRTL